METIPSETLCYPAKLANGHIKNLIDKDLKRIFYPDVMYESDIEGKKFSCPVVTSYSKVIKNNMDELSEKNVDFIYPFISLDSIKIAKKSLGILTTQLKIDSKELNKAIEKSWTEQEKYQYDVQLKAKEAIENAKLIKNI